MPTVTESVPAEEYISYKGVSIYHVYKNDDIMQPTRSFWFTTEEYGNPETGGDYQFDVRKLPTYSAASGSCDAINRRAITKAIDQGILTQDGVQNDSTTTSK